MPVEYRIDAERGIRIHTCWGTVRYDDIAESLSRAYSDPLCSKAFHVIWDLRGCTLDVSRNEVAWLVGQVKNLLGGETAGRLAMVVGSDSDYGIARMYELESEYQIDRKARVFRDYEDALAWMEGRVR